MPPKVVGPYKILATLGRGGIGTVYRAADRRTGDEVALKLLSTGPALEPVIAKRLVREFEALAELSHPNVVRVFDAGVFQGYPYLAMELVEGLDLRSYLSMDLGAPGPPRSLFTTDSPSDAAYDPAFETVGDELYEDDSEGDDEVDEHTDTSITGVPRFGVEELFAEAATDSFAAGEPRPRSPHGPQALRDYAKLASEPDTDDGSSSDGEVELPFEPGPAKAPEAHKPVRRPVDLEALNQPERIGRLKDALLQICEALGYIHSHGLVHRDLKPGNIMVDDDRRVRLMDFGLAKHLADETSVTGTGRVVGTYRYMAPEQAMGERVDGRADLYSLGALMYELLSGRPPYDAETPVELWQEILETEPPSLWVLNPQVDEVLGRIAHRLLRKDPVERFQTAEEVFELVIGG